MIGLDKTLDSGVAGKLGKGGLEDLSGVWKLILCELKHFSTLFLIFNVNFNVLNVLVETRC